MSDEFCNSHDGLQHVKASVLYLKTCFVERTFIRFGTYYRFPLLQLRPNTIRVPPQPHRVVDNSVAPLHAAFFTGVNVARNFHVEVIVHPLHHFPL